MRKNYVPDFSLNEFFQKITLEKQYVTALTINTYSLSEIKEQNYKVLNFYMFSKDKNLFSYDFLITHVANVLFNRKNTRIQIMKFSGGSKIACSAGTLAYSKRRKKVRVLVLKSITNFLLKKFKFLLRKRFALHLRNVKFRKSWILRKLKKKFSIKIIQNFNSYAYNGCRKKKVRRKKFRKKKKKKRWLSG